MSIRVRHCRPTEILQLRGEGRNAVWHRLRLSCAGPMLTRCRVSAGSAPEEGEPFAAVLDDYTKLIVPGTVSSLPCFMRNADEVRCVQG